MSTADVIAIFIADIHLSHNPPVIRSAEPDWYAAMARPLREVKDLAFEHGAPVICAGDVFDKWHAPAELINFAMDELPANFYSVPGQHDLPLHRYADVHKSAYWTLVKSGHIINLNASNAPCTPRYRRELGLTLHGFPYGLKFQPPVKFHKTRKDFHVAVVHHYCWIKGTGYPQAQVKDHEATLKSALSGYDIAVFGDNHIPFITQGSKPDVVNCGTLMRRRLNEVNTAPRAWLLKKSGGIDIALLDTSEDKFLAEESWDTCGREFIRTAELITELKSLGHDTLDFVAMLKGRMDRGDVSKEACFKIMEYIEDSD